jgi:hypothetical protein
VAGVVRWTVATSRRNLLLGFASNTAGAKSALRTDAKKWPVVEHSIAPLMAGESDVNWRDATV